MHRCNKPTVLTEKWANDNFVTFKCLNFNVYCLKNYFAIAHLQKKSATKTQQI